MHAFSTTMASVMGHKHATGLITRAQKLVTFFRASHQPLALLKKLAGNMGIKRMLITSNKTRFTSVHASLESVVRLQSALQEIARQQASLLSKEALNIIIDDMFFVRLKQICRLLEPFSLVIAAVQAARTTLADVMRYWLHLAKSVTGSSSDCLPPALKAHCFVAYNLRHQEMVSPLCKLALFLHPLYRDVVSNDKKNWVEVQMTAGNMRKSGYKYSKQQVQQLMEDIKRYKIHEEPYDCMLVDGELATLKLYWKVILSTGSNLDLPKLASTGGLLSVAILKAAFVLQCILTVVMAVVVADRSLLRLAEWYQPMRLTVFSGSAAWGLMSNNRTASFGNSRLLPVDRMTFQYSLRVASSPSTGIQS